MTTNEAVEPTRRGLFRLGAGAAVAAASASTASAQEEFDYGGWFEDVPNFEGTADRTGEDEVTVTVGAGGDLVFDPPAVHVDPGTTVSSSGTRGSTTSPRRSPASGTPARRRTNPGRRTRSP